MLTNTTPTESFTVAIETHGCKLNQADSSLLAREFAKAGYRLVATDEPTDVFVVNSCTVTHTADRKARHALRSARRRNPNATVVATGCYAERSHDELLQLQEVDIVIGNRDKASLVQQVGEWTGEIPVPCAVGAETDAFAPGIARTRAMVKIQEGCDQVCAYCIVPRVRGRERSIPPEDIVGEVNRHVAGGYKEVVLTGTQLGSYGFDLPDIDLTRLLDRILRETEIARVRISSLQPQDIGVGMLALWSNDRLCPHFHMPLQGGSDTVLKRMRRRYTGSLYLETVETIRDLVPNASVTADVIVGFPGETDRQFEETYALCERIGFADMHVFPYSVRPGTSAAYLEGRVAPNVKSDRVHALLTLSKHKAAEFRRRFIGTVRPVLWERAERANGASRWSGLTDNYIRVSSRSNLSLANSVTPARLTMHRGGLTYARVLEPLDGPVPQNAPH